MEWVLGGSVQSSHGKPTVDLWVGGIDRMLSGGVKGRVEVPAMVDELLDLQ